MNHSFNRTILAIGSHADDIEIFAGGTLLKYHDLGYEIVYVMSTNNMSGGVSQLNPDGTRASKLTLADPIETMKVRKAECDAACAVLGTKPIHLDHPQRHYHDMKTGKSSKLRYGCALPEGVPADVPSILTACDDPESVARITRLILEKDPECILTSGVAQRNIEHFATSLLVTLAFWQAVEEGYQGGLLHWREEHTFLGEANMRWDTFVNYSGYLDKKMELIALHKSQMPTAASDPEHGHRLLCKWKGGMCGVEAAENFTWVRRPVRRDNEIFGMNLPIYGELTGELLQNSR